MGSLSGLNHITKWENWNMRFQQQTWRFNPQKIFRFHQHIEPAQYNHKSMIRTGTWWHVPVANPNAKLVSMDWYLRNNLRCCRFSQRFREFLLWYPINHLIKVKSPYSSVFPLDVWLVKHNNLDVWTSNPKLWARS